MSKELFEACQSGDTNAVKSLIKSGVDVNDIYRDEHLKTVVACNGGYLERDFRTNKNIKPALLAACDGNYFEIVQILLENGADVNCHDKNGISPIIQASRNGNYKIAELLASNGINFNLYSNNSALIEASKMGHSNIAELLIDSGIDINYQNKDGRTALFAAFTNNQLNAAELLIQKGINVDHQDAEGHTALFKATINNKLGIAEILSNIGANLDKKNEHGKTALNNAMDKKCNNDVIEFLVKSGADLNTQDNNGNTPLINLAQNSPSKKITELLVKNGADITIKNNDGDTAFIKSIINKHTPLIKYYIKKRIDIETDKNGYTPLMHYVATGYCKLDHEICKTLGNNINSVNYDGNTALILAASNKNRATSKEVLHELIHNGANINIQNNNGDTALIKAINKIDIRSIEYCIQNGADSQLKNRYGNTALMQSVIDYSVSDIDSDTCKSLISNNINAENCHGDTALTLLSKCLYNNENDKIKFRMLIENGADINHKNNECCSAFDYIKDNKRLDNDIEFISFIDKTSLAAIIEPDLDVNSDAL